MDDAVGVDLLERVQGLDCEDANGLDGHFVLNELELELDIEPKLVIDLVVIVVALDFLVASSDHGGDGGD